MKYCIHNITIFLALFVPAICCAYPHISPYAYANCNPVNCLDPDGNSPVYSTTGVMLGTDDNGLQGGAIIMDAQLFEQGMSPDDAHKYDLGIDGLKDFDSLVNFFIDYVNLSSRPDWDGYLTLSEANAWYNNGNGQPLYVSLDKIDLSGIVSLGDDYIGMTKPMNLFWGSSCLNDALVYGTITLVRYPDDMVRSYSDTYNFDMKPWNSLNHIIRNIQTILGKFVAGKGTDYDIHIYGSSKLRTAPTR